MNPLVAHNPRFQDRENGLAPRLPILRLKRRGKKKAEGTSFIAVLHLIDMTIVRRFAFPFLCIFYLVACNAAKTISMEALGDTPARVTNRFVFPTSGSSAEAYLTRPAGPGPFPLMILLHGHTFESIGGAESLAPAA